MNLFALTDVPGARIIRFPLTQSLQAEIKALFSKQFESFWGNEPELIPFDGRCSPDEGELLNIADFTDIDGINEIVDNPLSVGTFNAQLHYLDKVKAIFTSHLHKGQKYILIQLFERRRLISSKNRVSMFFSKDTFQQINDSGITLDTKLLAVMNGNSLSFQSFYLLRRVFDMTEYFKEATNDEVAAFAGHKSLQVNDISKFLGQAGRLIRNKIALILQSKVLDNFTTHQIVAAAKNFNLIIQLSQDGRIILPEKRAELMRILRFLDEDYYESALSQTIYVSKTRQTADC
ncbi:Kiwa anti-phage protein KwaB-like domain-containing protein [Arsenophonus endosymbiont of Crataerina pallida]|uniref:Kiwa anti-phage protein KwaB-like domain-containing protein n=1 Tax=Arsenophonus endosymbiont of Crataerina pallida TaxID=3066235 RepID=UPI0030D1B5A1